MNATDPGFSIVINTDGRARSLAATLDCLRWLDHPRFEVCVVAGPTADGTAAVLERWAGAIKVQRCPVRNLSASRNMGIAMAAAEVVAFLDDDALPEPEWLSDLAAAYRGERVGGAGGFVHDPSGVGFQYRLGTADRLGRADPSWQRPAPELNFPYSANYPHLLGANSSFRKEALIGIGGFDEEYEYYLDETDLACRLVDAGWRIAQVEGAYVHHKFLPSVLRNQARVITNWYPIFKNRIYFGLVNGLLHHTADTVIAEARAFIEGFAQEMEWAIGQGLLSPEHRGRFRQDVDRAWRDGLARGLSGQRRLPDFATLRRDLAASFLPFPTKGQVGARRTFCFLSQEYPPGTVGGVGRYIHQLARSIADLGHQVHVLTRGQEQDGVEFEDGVWVHRLLPRPAAAVPPEEPVVPAGIAAHAATMLAGVHAVAAKRPVAAVYAPIWDCEGLGVLAEGRFPLVVGLQTMLRFWLASHPHRRDDTAFMDGFVGPMLAAETRLLRQANGLHAISHAIAEEIAAEYGVPLGAPRVAVIPLGLEDWTALPAEAPPAPSPGTLRLLFIGRLEERKGIDILLEVARRVLARHPQVRLDLVGNDAIEGPGGATWRAAFEADPATAGLRDRVAFHGQVPEERLRGFYRACDLLVTPSRFESFGLMLVEGMMFGKPVVGCRAGGMTEVVEDGVSGLLAEPGDAASLEACLERLIGDAALRAAMGEAARARYEACFTPDRMARDVVDFLCRVVAERGPAPARALAPA